jgi:hypothetical protein
MAIAEHRDQDFKKDGSFYQIKNSQIQDTVHGSSLLWGSTTP